MRAWSPSPLSEPRFLHGIVGQEAPQEDVEAQVPQASQGESPQAEVTSNGPAPAGPFLMPGRLLTPQVLLDLFDETVAAIVVGFLLETLDVLLQLGVALDGSLHRGEELP